MSHTHTQNELEGRKQSGSLHFLSRCLLTSCRCQERSLAPSAVERKAFGVVTRSGTGGGREGV